MKVRPHNIGRAIKYLNNCLPPIAYSINPITKRISLDEDMGDNKETSGCTEPKAKVLQEFLESKGVLKEFIEEVFHRCDSSYGATTSTIGRSMAHNIERLHTSIRWSNIGLECWNNFNDHDMIR